MTKAELIDQIAEKLLVKKKDVAPIVEEVFVSIKEALSKREQCHLHGDHGYVVLGVAGELTEDSVAHLGKLQRPLRVLDQWMYHRIAAR